MQKISLDRRKLPDLESEKAIKTALGLNSSTVEIISPVMTSQGKDFVILHDFKTGGSAKTR